MSAIDSKALAATLARLNGNPESAELERSLDEIVSAVVAVFGVGGSGLMFLDEDSVLRFVAASDDPGRYLEQTQEEMGVGPCVDAVINDELTICHDMSRETRWAGLGRVLAARGVHSVLGVPVHLGGTAVGSLDVYYNYPHAWVENEVTALVAFGALVERLIGAAVLARQQSKLVQQLQYALDHRVVIERAVGVLMGRDGLDAVTAFNRLRAFARSNREKVAVTAAAILAAAPASSSHLAAPPESVP